MTYNETTTTIYNTTTTATYNETTTAAYNDTTTAVTIVPTTVLTTAITNATITASTSSTIPSTTSFTPGELWLLVHWINLILKPISPRNLFFNTLIHIDSFIYIPIHQNAEQDTTKAVYNFIKLKISAIFEVLNCFYDFSNI